MANLSSFALIVEVRDMLLKSYHPTQLDAQLRAIELVGFANGSPHFNQTVCLTNHCLDCFAHCAALGSCPAEMNRKISGCKFFRSTVRSNPGP